MATIIYNNEIEIGGQGAHDTITPEIRTQPCNETDARLDQNPMSTEPPKTLYSRAKKPVITLYFHEKDTFLHSILDQDRGDEVIRILHGKALLIIMLSLAFGVAIVSTYISWYSSASHNTTVNVILPMLMIIIGTYAFSGFLAINRIIFRESVRSFEFWLKTFYVIRLNIAWYGYNYDNFTALDVMISFAQFYLIMLMSTIEGFQFGLGKRIALTVVISIVFSALAYLETFSDELNPKSVFRVSDDTQISLQATVGASYRLIAIFTWKQTITGLIWRGKSAVLKMSPKIEFIAD
eukprot:173907_1